MNPTTPPGSTGSVVINTGNPNLDGMLRQLVDALEQTGRLRALVVDIVGCLNQPGGETSKDGDDALPELPSTGDPELDRLLAEQAAAYARKLVADADYEGAQQRVKDHVLSQAGGSGGPDSDNAPDPVRQLLAEFAERLAAAGADLLTGYDALVARGPGGSASGKG